MNQQNDGQPARDPNPFKEELGDDDLIEPLNRRRAKNIATLVNRNRPVRERANLQPAVQLVADEEDDTDLDEAGAIGTIIPPPLEPRVKFNIISTMIQLLSLKGLFGGLLGDDPNMHLVNFINICKFFDNPRVGQNVIHLWLFLLSLSGKETMWLNELAPDSIVNRRQLEGAFQKRFF